MSPPTYANATEATSLTAIIPGAVIMAAATVAFVVAVVICPCRKRPAATTKSEPAADPTAQMVTSFARIPDDADYALVEENESHATGFTPAFKSRHTIAINEAMTDPAILALRVPLEAITCGDLLLENGHTLIYGGTFNGATVAIKTLPPSICLNREQCELLLAEIKFLSSLDHEGIVRVFGVAWRSIIAVHMIYEFVDGGDLRAVLWRFEHSDDPQERRRPGIDADKFRVALSLARALTYLHHHQPKPIVHRDLHSRNVLVTRDYGAKLIDFGWTNERTATLRSSNVTSGLYVSPEVITGESFSVKSDIFSFGVLLSELDTQQLPYAGSIAVWTMHDLMRVIRSVGSGELRVTFSEDTDPELVALGHECVRLDPTARPSSLEILERLERLLQAQHGILCGPR